MKFTFDDIKNKLKKLKLPKLNRKYLSVAVAAVVAVIVFACVTVVINEQKPKSAVEGELFRLDTRFPLDCSDIYYGRELAPAIRISWYDDTIRLDDGEPTYTRLDAEMYPVTGRNGLLVFSSSDDGIAQIDNAGTIIAMKPGSVELSVRDEYSGVEAKAFLHIIQPATGLLLDKNTINIYTTDTGIGLTARVLPENASNSAVKWYSKDTGIVEVDQTGHLKPVSTGMTEVVASTADNRFSAKCFVNVINEVIKADSVKILNKTGTELGIGDTWTGLASVLPANARNMSVEWESSNPAAATVTKNGVVKAVSAGTAIITARSADGPYDSVEIHVTGAPAAPDLDMNPTYTVAGGVNYTVYNMTLERMTELTMATSPTYNDGTGNKKTDSNRLRMYIDPNEFASGAYKYQFMDLSKTSGISRDALAAYLDGKGILSGKTDTFLKAAHTYNVNELYLVAHACIETGYGSSTLANGVVVNGQRVYNMFGIGAYDYSAVATGSQRAYNEGWTSPEAAIMGGAKYISESYVNSTENRQNTIYKMRWNPDNPGVHLYAGDVAWAVSQTAILEKLIAAVPNAVISYDVPVYAGSNAAELR